MTILEEKALEEKRFCEVRSSEPTHSMKPRRKGRRGTHKHAGWHPLRFVEKAGLLGGGVDGGIADYQEFVFFIVGFKLHFVLVEGELDGSVGRDDGLVGWLGLADLVFGGGRANDVLLTEEVGGFFFALLLGAASDRGFGDDGARHGF